MPVVSLNERRKYPRISEAVALRLNSEADASSLEPLDAAPTHVVKMSCGGLRFAHHTSLDAETRLHLSIHLSSSGRTVHIATRVVSSGKEKCDAYSSTQNGQHCIQVEFLKVESDVHQLLADHINYVINKTGISSNFAIPA